MGHGTDVDANGEAVPRDEVAGWIRRLRLAPAEKLVLLLIFDHAGPQQDGTWTAWPSARVLAQEAGFASRATVRKHIVSLEAAGIVERVERARDNGSRTSNSLVLLVGSSTPVSVPPPATQSVPPPAPEGVPQKPSEGSPQLKPSNREERAREQAQKLPDDFPSELTEHARSVFRVLRSLAEQHNAREVTPRAVGLVMMGHPGRRYVEEAHALAAWAQAPPTPIKDVVGRYRTWLGRANTYAGTENLGAPSTNGHANVRPIRGRRSTAADYQALKSRIITDPDGTQRFG